MVQFLAMLFVLPLSRRAYRVANMIMMEALWSELIWLVDWWAGVKVGFFLWVCFVLWVLIPAETIFFFFFSSCRCREKERPGDEQWWN